MNYELFRHTFSQSPLITIDDILVRFPDIDRKILSRWSAGNLLHHIKRGLYALPGTVFDESWRELCANVIVQPSYISLEYALSMYHLIPEEVPMITSVTTLKTQSYRLGNYGGYRYQSIIPSAFTGYTVQSREGAPQILCATPAKAIIDFLYFHPDYCERDDFLEWRIIADHVRESVKTKDLITFSGLFHRKRLESQVSNFISFIWS